MGDPMTEVQVSLLAVTKRKSEANLSLNLALMNARRPLLKLIK